MKHLIQPALFCSLIVLTLATAAPAQTDEPLAEVDGVSIKAQEVDKAIGMQLARLEEQMYRLRQQKLDALIEEKLLEAEARKRGMSRQALLEAEVSSKVAAVADAEVDGFFNSNKGQLDPATPGMREQVRAFLQTQKHTSQREEFVRSLRSQSKVVVHLKPPTPFKADIRTEGAPFRGAANAPVTIVELSDFHCPYCKRVQPILNELLKKFDGKVKHVFRDLPLDQLHPDARKAAEAARCAKEQGKFWEYHAKLMAGSTDASQQTLKRLAAEAGLDAAPFEQCLSTGKYSAAVQKDVEEATALGVNGTPAFFINGRLLTGAQPLEAFSKVIEEELAERR
jgi:protein-disulfide isomerase